MESKYVWSGLALIAMWMAVLFPGVYGPAFEVSSRGGDVLTIPVVWGIAFCATIGTVIVAILGFRM